MMVAMLDYLACGGVLLLLPLLGDDDAGVE